MGRAIHRQVRRVCGWPDGVYEVVCNIAWVSNSTDDDAKVTCKRCLRKMAKTAVPLDARSYAVTAHGDQRYGEAPYVVHLDAVAEIVGEDKLLRTVAYLHDVLEDTDRSVGEIEARFGADAARAVMVLTDPVGTRRERKSHSVRVLAELDQRVAWQRAALIVKIADRLANVRASKKSAHGGDLLQMYTREHPAFRIAAHRHGMCVEEWAELDQLLGL